MAKWYVVRGDQERGPFEDAQLKEFAANGKLKRDHQIRRDGSTTTRKAGDIKGLFPENTEAAIPQLPSATVPPSRIGAFFQHPAILAILMACCFPIGLLLVWFNPRRSQTQKWIWTSGFAFFFIGMMIIAQGRVKYAREELAAAHQQWASGDKQIAISKYRRLIEDHLQVVPDGDTSIIFGRVIDFDAESGNLASVEKLLKVAEEHRILPSVTSEKARSRIESRTAEQSNSASDKNKRTANVASTRESILAEVERNAPVAITVTESEIKYDFSKDDYNSIPAGCKKDTRRLTLAADGEFNGKPETREGYVTSSGEFIDHGTFTTWSDSTETIKMRDGTNFHKWLHGIVKLYSTEGKVTGEYPFVQGRRHGISREWAPNGTLIQEYCYVHGKQRGVQRVWLDSGKPKLFVSLDHETLHGIKKAWWSDGRLATIECFRQGKRVGKFYSWNEDGSEAEFGEWDNDRPIGKCNLKFIGYKDRQYFIAADDKPWNGGTTEEFIAKLKYFALRDYPHLGFQFVPDMGIAMTFIKSEDEFFQRFGRPDVVEYDHENGSIAPAFLQNKYNLWTYRCANGVVVLRSQPTTSQGDERRVMAQR